MKKLFIILIILSFAVPSMARIHTVCVRNLDGTLVFSNLGRVDHTSMYDMAATYGFTPDQVDIIELDDEQFKALLVFSKQAEPGASEEEEIKALKQDLKTMVAWQFRMILEMYRVGRLNGIWDSADFSAEIRQKAVEWESKLSRLQELGE